MRSDFQREKNDCADWGLKKDFMHFMFGLTACSHLPSCLSAALLALSTLLKNVCKVAVAGVCVGLARFFVDGGPVGETIEPDADLRFKDDEDGEDGVACTPTPG